MSVRLRRMDWSNIDGLRFNGLDLAMFAWLMLSVLVGLVRGLVFELISLLGWAVAFFGAFWLAPLLAPHLPIADSGSVLNEAASFACAFVAILILWGLAARLVRLMLHATPLRLPDRVLGAGFGLARGVVVLLLVAAVVGFTPMEASHAWQHSRMAAWLNEALQQIHPWLPERFARHQPFAVSGP